MAAPRATRTLALDEEPEAPPENVPEAIEPDPAPGEAPPTLRDCAQLLGRFLMTQTRYADSLPDQHRIQTALRIHDDGNIPAAWSTLVTLIDGLYGPIIVQQS